MPDPALHSMRSAIEDVLKCCRKPGRSLTHGRSLASALLTHVPSNLDDCDAALAEALEALLRTEIERLRRESVDAQSQWANLDAVPYLRAHGDDASPLTALYLVWAFYVERLEIGRLAEVLGLTRRPVYERLSQGRSELELIIRRQAPSQAPADGVRPDDDEDPNTTATAAEAPVPNSPAIDQPTVMLGTPTADSERPSIDTTRTPASATDDQLQRLIGWLAVLLVVLCGAVWLMAPVWTALALAATVVWRCGVYAWRALRAWQTNNAEVRTWTLAAIVPWLVAGGMVALVVSDTRGAPASSVASLAGDVLRVLCAAAAVLLLCVMDVMFWIEHGAPAWGPWRYWNQQAQYWTKQRWGAVSLMWLLVGLLGMTMALTSIF